MLGSLALSASEPGPEARGVLMLLAVGGWMDSSWRRVIVFDAEPEQRHRHRGEHCAAVKDNTRSVEKGAEGERGGGACVSSGPTR